MSDFVDFYPPPEFGLVLSTFPPDYIHYLSVQLSVDDRVPPPSPKSTMSDAFLSAASLSGHGSSLSILVLRGPLVTDCGLDCMVPRLCRTRTSGGGPRRDGETNAAAVDDGDDDDDDDWQRDGAPAASADDGDASSALFSAFDRTTSLFVSGFSNLTDLIIIECPNVSSTGTLAYLRSCGGKGIARLTLRSVFCLESVCRIEELLDYVAEGIPELEFLDLKWNDWTLDLDKTLVKRLAAKVKRLVL